MGQTSRSHQQVEQHNQMLSNYRNKLFNVAIEDCKKLKGSFKGEMDHYYELWIERCEEMLTMKLPANWDGVYRATSK